MVLVLLLIVLVYYADVTHTQTCSDDYSCAYSTLTSSPICSGYHSCTGAYIESSSAIYCYGSYSCYKATKLAQTSSGHSNIQCDGLFSCAEIDDLSVVDGNVYCYGELSCYKTTMVVSENDLYCMGDRSCEQATIYSRSTNYIYGHAAATGATFYTQDSYVSYQFHGRKAGDGATIVCGNSCGISCYQDGCNNLTLVCDGSCSFTIDCDYSEENDNCPDGVATPLPDSAQQMSDTTITTYDNSYWACYTLFTGADNCDSTNECRSATIDNRASKVPICCTAYQSCSVAADLLTYVNMNSSDIAGVAIRCDGGFACESIQGTISSENAGSMYFSGYKSGYNAGNVIGQYNETDIFCTACLSCESAQIHNASNLFCGGYQSCSSSIVGNFSGSIYAYGRNSASSIKITGVATSVYCAAYACRYATVHSVAASLYCAAYRACEYATLHGVTESVYCVVYEACQYTTITGVEAIYAIGYRALFNAKISGTTNVCGLLFLIALCFGVNDVVVVLFCL